MSETGERLVVGVPTEMREEEARVALVPSSVTALQKAGCDVLVQSGAGTRAGFEDSQYTEAGATICETVDDLVERCDAIVSVTTPWVGGDRDVSELRAGQTLIGCCDPLWDSEKFQPLAAQNVTCFALELLPRITRAQSMDILSSMATVAGYKAVLLAAEHSNRLFPMLMTAAGTIQPARVLVVGAGVAGLQAIATARRLGAVVSGYDVRPAVREQVESLGAKFIELDLQTSQSEQSGGYAKQMDEAFYDKQRALMAEMVAASDVVITTAAIPGKPSPLLITADMVSGMSRGSVIIDLAAERGGNCEVTKCDEIVEHEGVTVLGPSNLPATVPLNASEMYSRNVTNFLKALVDSGRLNIDPSDEVHAGTLVTHEGRIAHSQIRELLGLDTEQPEDATTP